MMKKEIKILMKRYGISKAFAEYLILNYDIEFKKVK